jgi:hypothetical protein
VGIPPPPNKWWCVWLVYKNGAYLSPCSYHTFQQPTNHNQPTNPSTNQSINQSINTPQPTNQSINTPQPTNQNHSNPLLYLTREALNEVRPHLLILLQAPLARVDPSEVENEDAPPLCVAPLFVCVCVCRVCFVVVMVVVVMWGVCEREREGQSVRGYLIIKKKKKKRRRRRRRRASAPPTEPHTLIHTHIHVYSPARSNAPPTPTGPPPHPSPPTARATGPPQGGTAGSCARRGRLPPRRPSGSGGTVRERERERVCVCVDEEGGRRLLVLCV